jgi:hypothetical protein
MKKKKIKWLNLNLLITSLVLVVIQFSMVFNLIINAVQYKARAFQSFITMVAFFTIYIIVDLIFDYLEESTQKKDIRI